MGRTLLRDDEQVAICIAEAALVHGCIRRKHVDGVALLALGAVQAKLLIRHGFTEA